ncbi:MAG: hypothetical protein H0X66_09755 [Verrucomicrobia bacterium]|nr:hypothetical protein [Verrucomicrobiota bacterium]
MKQAKFLSSSNLFLCAGLLSAVVIGCGKEEINVYTAPKDSAAPPAYSAAESRTSPNNAAITAPPKPHVTWKTPADWEDLAPTSMRVGNFSITEGEQKAEMAILPFPGSVGGELENVNRWRGEVALDPVTDKELEVEEVTIGPVTGKLYDLIGPKFSTVAAILEKDGTSWFFKMRGDKELVAKNKRVLVDFLKTIEFAAPEKQQAHIAIAPYAEEEDEDDNSGQDQGPKWQTPAHWKEGPPKQMVVKNWDIAGADNKTANIAISSFPGEVGGVVQNVNRWRGQIGLPPMTENEIRDAIKVMETSDGQSEALYVDFTGKDRSGQPTRMISAIVPQGGDTWFYKILGDIAVIEREKTAFLKLVQTANYH